MATKAKKKPRVRTRKPPKKKAKPRKAVVRSGSIEAGDRTEDGADLVEKGD